MNQGILDAENNDNVSDDTTKERHSFPVIEVIYNEYLLKK